MLAINIPGFRELRLEQLVLDYNGTLACDGQVLEGVKELLDALSSKLEIHILTADTFGAVKERVAPLAARVQVIDRGQEAQAKAAYVQKLGTERTVAIGNGRNDRLMLKEAALGIAVVQTEGAAVEALLAAAVVVPGILEALGLLLHPMRLIATLRM